MAAVLASGPRALLSHRAAGALWEIAPYEGVWIDVTTPTHQRTRRPLARHTSPLPPDDCAICDGIPVTGVARTLLDLAEISDRRRVELAIGRADKLGLFDLRAIEALCARSHGRHGLANLTEALAQFLPDSVRSPLEYDLLAFCRDHGLPLPEVNVIVAGHEVDAAWVEARLIVELDSYEHHRGRAAFERDRIRDAELKLAGWEVIRITWRRLHDHPAAVASLLHRLLLARRGLRTRG